MNVICYIRIESYILYCLNVECAVFYHPFDHLSTSINQFTLAFFSSLFNLNNTWNQIPFERGIPGQHFLLWDL